MTGYDDVPTSASDPDQWKDDSELLKAIKNGEWLDQQTFPVLHQYVPGVLVEGMSMLAGPPKIGKSWIVYNFALALASGGHALGCLPVEACDVLYLALEDGDRRVQGRARLAMESAPLPARFDYATKIAPGTANATIRAWLRRREDPRHAVVVVDTAAKVRPPSLSGNSNAYGEDYAFGTALKSIADDHPGMALLVVHHTRKAASDDFVQSASGTNGFPGAADTILILSRPRGESEAVLSMTSRDMPETEYRLQTLPEGGWKLAGGSLEASALAQANASATDSLGEVSAKIVRFINSKPNGVKTTDVAKAVGEDPNKVRTYLRRLLDAGRIDQPQRGYYTPVTTVTSVTSEVDEQAEVTLVTDVTPLSESDTDTLIASGPQAHMAIVKALVGESFTPNRQADALKFIKQKVSASDWKRCGDYLLSADHHVAADAICVSPSCRRPVGEVLAASQKVLCERCLTKGIEGP